MSLHRLPLKAFQQYFTSFHPVKGINSTPDEKHDNSGATVFKVTGFDKGNYLVVESNFLFSPRVELYFFEKHTQDLSGRQELNSKTNGYIYNTSIVKNLIPSNSSELGVRVTTNLNLALFQSLRITEQALIINSYQRSSIFINPSGGANNAHTPKDRWQFLGDPQQRQQVYSAFYDNRPEIIGYHPLKEKGLVFGTIRIFGIMRTRLTSKIYCTFYNVTEHPIQTVEALEASPIKENFNLPFSAYTIACPLGTRDSNPFVDLPKYVALTYDGDPVTVSNPTLVPVRYSDEVLKGMDPSRKLAVCTGPIHNNYSQARRIAEYVRLSQLMGVEKLYFYYLNSSPAVKKVLDYFQHEGLAEVLNWNLEGYVFEKDVRYAGIFAALNECVYRATFVDNFKYVAIIDLDEFLISFKNSNLVEFIESLDDGKFGSFVFRTVFFHKNDEPSTFVSPMTARNDFLYTQARTVRTSSPFPNHNRSKYVVKARAAIEMGNHFMWRSIYRNSEKPVSTKEGLVFHYRDECLGSTCKTQKQNETTMSRYGAVLWKLVDKTCEEIFVDGICPVEE